MEKLFSENSLDVFGDYFQIDRMTCLIVEVIYRKINKSMAQTLALFRI